MSALNCSKVLESEKMKMDLSVSYALLAVGYIATHQAKKNIVSAKISEECDIPREYLLKILGLLVRANVLRSERGPYGGFRWPNH